MEDSFTSLTPTRTRTDRSTASIRDALNDIADKPRWYKTKSYTGHDNNLRYEVIEFVFCVVNDIVQVDSEGGKSEVSIETAQRLVQKLSSERAELSKRSHSKLWTRGSIKTSKKLEGYNILVGYLEEILTWISVKKKTSPIEAHSSNAQVMHTPPDSANSVNYQQQEHDRFDAADGALELAKQPPRRVEQDNVSYSQRHEQYSNRRTQGTCDWIFQHPEFQRWQSNKGIPGFVDVPSPILWLSGKPGVGKSVLASHIVNNASSNLSRNIAYFYFSKGQKQRLSDVAHNLWYQIRSWNQPMGQPADSEHDQHSALTQVTFQAIRNSMPPDTIFVFDGWDIDNMIEPGKFDWLLKELKRKTIKALITSRSEPRDFQLDAIHHVSLPQAEQTKDIHRFANMLIESNGDAPASALLQSQDKLEQLRKRLNLIESFTEVQLYIHKILRQTTMLRLESVLNEGDPMWHALSDYEYDFSSVYKKGLLWVLQRKKPLRIEALQEVLAFLEPCSAPECRGREELNPLLSRRCFVTQDRYPTIEFLRSCGMDLLWIDDVDRTVAFLHENLLAQSWHLPSMTMQDMSLGDMCVSYLLIEELEDLDYHSTEQIEKWSRAHPFLLYAACAWQEHIRKGELSHFQQDNYRELLNSPRRLHAVLSIEAWQAFYWREEHEWQATLVKIEETTATEIAIRCSDVTYLQTLLEFEFQPQTPQMTDHRKPYDRNSGAHRKEITKSKNGSTSQSKLLDLLCLAYDQRDHGCFDIVYERLLNLLADTQSFRGPTREIQQIMDIEKWRDIITWFNDHHELGMGEEVYGQLRAALMRHDILAVQSAWSQTHDPIERDKIGLLILHEAIKANKDSIVRDLLQFGCDPAPAQDWNELQEFSCLHAAAHIGSVIIVELLLEHGVDVNDLHQGENALFPTIDYANGHGTTKEVFGIIRVLVNKGIDINAVSKAHGTALEYAAAMKLFEIVELLFSYGANVSTKLEKLLRTGGTLVSTERKAYETMLAQLERRRQIQQKLREGALRISSQNASSPRRARSPEISYMGSYVSQSIECDLPNEEAFVNVLRA